MSRRCKTVWTAPVALPIWIMSWEVWKEGALYRKGTMRIPAETEQEARDGVEQIMWELMPNLFLEAEVRLTSALTCESK